MPLATVPDLDECLEYLGDTSFDDDTIEAAFEAEIAAQAAVCKIPTTIPDDETVAVASYPRNLLDALYRRVAHNLALRALPLGVQPFLSDSAVAVRTVGGLDAEVARLEAPYRKRAVG